MKWSAKSKRRAEAPSAAASAEYLAQETFHRTIHLEQKRCERSGRGFVLMLVDFRDLAASEKNRAAVRQVAEMLKSLPRETDFRGWYQADGVVGVILTEIDAAARAAAIEAISTRTRLEISSILSVEQASQVKILFYVFPDDGELTENGITKITMDLEAGPSRRPTSKVFKRAMDIVGSLIALTIFSPLLLAIAAAIKLTSKGPILFRQERVGLEGRRFTFLKFRSMNCETDHKIHEQYISQFISGATEQDGVYKIKADPRVTPIGRFLRKTSLDELPQFLNVLKGDMSLVGPRPPVQYEVDRYHVWHRRRYLSVKPGITGLWQVAGRSRTKFDDMVRLDLQYIRAWTLWLDIQIILRTPRAVISGDGAY
jgi:exopolysaccharide biosynthesis polyprenyl glycosylphosphotransferase